MSDSRAIAVSKLRRLLEEIDSLTQQRNSEQFKKWRRDTIVAIRRTFGGDATYVDEFEKIRYSPSIVLHDGRDNTAVYQRAHKSGLESASAMLRSMLEEVDEYGLVADVEDGQLKPSFEGNKVFIVHGRDEGAREEVARIVEKLGIEPVILTEQASSGSTIIEKVEQNADVGFAVVLLTPDDAGGLRDGDDVRSRARQNVIFELGFFIGRLGRAQVCALTKGDVEIPSDYSGVVYIDMGGQQDWRIGLVRELKAAGYVVDANRII